MKKWYESKTLWVNVLSLVAIIIHAVSGEDILDAETQVVLLSVINLVLRLVTKHEISWKGGENDE